MKELFFEKFQREELPPPLPLGSYSETTCSASSLVRWEDGRHTFPGYY